MTLGRIAKPQKGLLFTLLAIVLVTLMLAIVVTYVILGINFNNQASQSYGILGTSDFASSMQSTLPSILTASLQKALGAYMSANVVGWWPLEGNTNDYSRNANNGAPVNVIYSTVNGIQVAAFNGINSYIEIGAVGLPTGSSPRTTAIWFKLNSNVAQELFGYGQNSGGLRWGMYYDGSGNLYIEEAGYSTSFAWTYNTNWNSFVVTFPSGSTTISQALLYLNGVQQTTSSSNHAVTTTLGSDGQAIGGLPQAGSITLPTSGLLSNLQIYNIALTATQVASLYAEGIGGVPVTINTNSTLAFPINASAANTLASIVSGIPPVPGSTLSDYASALQKQALSHNVNVIIANQSVTVFQTSPLWLNITYSALAVVNSTFGTVLYPLRASAALPEATAYANITVSNIEGARFGGTGAFANVPSSGGIVFNGKSAMAIAAWVYPTAFLTTPDTSTIATKSQAYYFELDGSGRVSTYLQGPNSARFISTNTLPLNRWSQVALVYNGVGETIYINGIPDNSIAATGTISDTSGDYFGIGANLNTAGLLYTSYQRFFSGQIANVQLYSNSLTTTQVASLYSEGIGGAPVSATTGWWPLNSNSNDYSGNSYAGTGNSITYLSASASGQFQQMLTLNAAQYAAYERPNLGNIRFYQNNAALPSWCESGCASSNTTSVFWVKLPGSMPASSSTVITMAFLPKYVDYNSGAGAQAGEAPQLSGILGQYDNGGNVFYSYTNTGTIAINTPSNFPFISDSYLQASSGGEEDLDYVPLGVGSSTNQYVAASISPTASQQYFIYTSPTCCTNGNTQAYAFVSGSYYINTLTMLSTTSYNMQINYNGMLSSVTSQTTTGGTASAGSLIRWTRVRAYPPNGIMPGVAFNPLVVNLV